MKTYLLTGGATGIGATIREALVAAGNRVITVDIKDGDYLVDLSDKKARQAVIKQIKADHSSLDGVITCAGVASHFPDRRKILAINYAGTVELIAGLRQTLGRGARVVAISSNSAPMCASEALVTALLDGNFEVADNIADTVSGHDCYSGSKQAVARWVRKMAPAYARKGISMNAIAPGYIETPMTQAVAQNPEYGEAIKQFVASIPAGRPGLPEDVARLVSFLLKPGSDFIAGSLIFVDGAHDAMLRPDVFG
tara:strand:+ start:2858 stop:3616 length:759 start_codon:yes stop_codon:yes gene_type:complete